MKFYILVEDTLKEEAFGSEHGLSIYFEKDSKKFLFDCGQTDVFLKNAKRLGIDIGKVDYLVLSHGHYDHTRGLKHMPITKKLKIIAHPGAIEPKYIGERYAGFPDIKNDWIICLEDNPKKLTDHVHFLGQIPGERKSSLGHYIKDGVKHTDFLLDDSAIAIIEDGKAIILSGCAHSGIVNIVGYAKKLFVPQEIIVVGGFHMLDYSDNEISDTIKALKKLNVARIFPGHCTGEKAVSMLLNAFEGERLYSGRVIEI